MQSSEKLAMMANQIARNLLVRGEAEAVEATAEHIRRFWDPRMRAGLAAYVAAGGKLTPVAEAAARRLGNLEATKTAD